MERDWTAAFAPRAERMTASEIRELLKLIDRPEIISFAGGIPDPDLFPTDRVAEAYAEVFRSNAQRASALQYSISEGHAPLREWIRDDAARRFGIEADLDEIVVTNGSQQALDFIGKLFVGAGDPVLVTAPTYLGALQAFAPYEPRYVALPMDEEGVRLDALEAALAAGRPRFLYLVPDFQNPTGVSTSAARREAVVELCARRDVPIVEDAAYERLRFEGEPLPPLAALDARRNGGRPANVIYCGTFSKTVAPALRVGWTLAPAEVVRKLVLAKQAGDLHASTVNQMVLHRVVRDGLDAHVARLVRTYRERRDAMLAALAEHMPPGVAWTRPAGGMFVWLDLPEGTDGAELLARAVREADVAFVPGGAFYADRSRPNTLRLSFSTAKPERIREGIRRLAGLLG